MKLHAADITTKDINKLHAFIESHLTPKDQEKKQFGEVFTPLWLVNKLLKAVKTSHGYKNFWKNPEIRILDPAAGIGNFPIVAYELLMDGLKDVKGFKDEEKRRKHILENMLYMVELNPINVRLMKKIFGSSKYKLNIIEGDFLDKKTGKKLRRLVSDKTPNSSFEGFDLVMGNPPFQVDSSSKVNGTGYHGSLWDKFIVEIVDKWLLKGLGLLAFINPPSWRKPEHTMWQVIGKRQLHYIDMYNDKDGMQIFHSGTRFDCYIMQNSSIKTTTTVIDDENITTNLDLKDWKFLPSGKYDTFRRLFNFNDSKETFNVIFTTVYHGQKTYISRQKKGAYKYPIVHSITMEGAGFLYSNTNERGHFGEPKIILSFGRYQYPVNDYKGQFGMSQMTFGLPIKTKKEGDMISAAINSDEFKEMIKFSKWSTFQTDYRMFNYLRKDFWKSLVTGSSGLKNSHK